MCCFQLFTPTPANQSKGGGASRSSDAARPVVLTAAGCLVKGGVMTRDFLFATAGCHHHLDEYF